MLHRWNQHCAQAKSSKGGRWHFPNAIRKYGKDAFEHAILQKDIPTLELANIAEKFAIEFLCTQDPEYGFNLAEGGTYTLRPIRKNPWDDPEYRTLIMVKLKEACNKPEFLETVRKNQSGKKASQETRMKIGLSSKGRKLSLETREKISAIHKGKTQNQEVIARRTALLKGVKPSPERLTSIRATNKLNIGKKHSLKVREKISLSLKNRPPKTHCKYGHSLDDAYESNVRTRRTCRTCSHIKYIHRRQKRLENVPS